MVNIRIFSSVQSIPLIDYRPTRSRFKSPQSTESAMQSVY